MLKLRIPLPIFRSAKEIVNGKNARMALKGIVANRALVVISKSFRNSIHFEQISRLINAESVSFVDKTWVGEPSKLGLKRLIAAFEAFSPDYIIALGGGSVIDGAKLAWLFYEHPLIDSGDLFRPFSLPPLRGKAKFAAIPTTAGSGSEVSSAAVLSDDVNYGKKAVVTHDFLPDLVILDPELIAEVPVRILRTTIADALSHAVEGYVSQISHPLMDCFAEKSVQLIYQNRTNFEDDIWNLQVYEDIQYAAMLAGWVQNHCMVGLSHSIAHQLGNFGLGHGLANGLLMPAVIDFNCSDQVVKDRYEYLCAKVGMPDINSLKKLFVGLVGDGKPALVFTAEDVSAIGKSALLDPAGKVNPVIFDTTDIAEIIKVSL